MKFDQNSIISVLQDEVENIVAIFSKIVTVERNKILLKLPFRSIYNVHIDLHIETHLVQTGSEQTDAAIVRHHLPQRLESPDIECFPPADGTRLE